MFILAFQGLLKNLLKVLLAEEKLSCNIGLITEQEQPLYINSLPFLRFLKLMAEEDRDVLLPRTDSPRDASPLDQRPGQWQ